MGLVRVGLVCRALSLGLASLKLFLWRKFKDSPLQICVVGQVSRTREVIGDEVVVVGHAGVELVAVLWVGDQVVVLCGVCADV